MRPAMLRGKRAGFLARAKLGSAAQAESQVEEFCLDVLCEIHFQPYRKYALK